MSVLSSSLGHLVEQIRFQANAVIRESQQDFTLGGSLEFLQKWLYEVARLAKEALVLLSCNLSSWILPVRLRLPLFFRFCFLGIDRCHGNKATKKWQIFAINSSFFLSILIFPRWNFFKLSYFVKMILTNILQGKKYGSFRLIHRYHVISYF